MNTRSARTATSLHFGLLAASLAAAKALLYTSGTAILLARTGVETMPVFYVLLAAVAVLVAVGFSGVVDRIAPMRLFRHTLVVILALTGLLRLAVAYDSPITHFAALASAHLYDMITDIVFWVAVAQFLTSYDLKRATPWLYLGIAGGGALGGLLAGVLSQVLAPDDLLLGVPPFVVLALIQLRLAGRCLEVVPDTARDDDDEEEEGYLDALKGLPELCRTNKLALLLASNGLLLTVVYSLSEYLVFVAYTDAFPDEAELTAFLGVVFALLQASEFVLLLLLSRVLVDRAGPITRNLIFPLTSLLSLLLFAFGPRFAGAILTHINTEAVSNAVFEPVNNTNYAALPRHVHGRVRTLADGILYPIGLAVGGALLILVEGDQSVVPGFVLAILSCLVFVGINAALGRNFLPALIRHLRAGVEHFALVPRQRRTGAADVSARIGDLWRSGDPVAAMLAIDLAADAPERLLAAIARASVPSDPILRVRLCRQIGRLGAEALPAIRQALASTDPERRRLGLELAIACDHPDAVAEIAGTADPAAPSVLEDVLRRERAGQPQLAAWQARRPERVQSGAAIALLHALLHAPHGRYTDLVLAIASTIPAPGLHAVLTELARDGRIATGASARALAVRMLDHPDAKVRTDALLCLAKGGCPDHIERLSACLGDGDAGVRRAAAQALTACGEAAVAVLGRAVSGDRVTARSAIEALGRIGGASSRAALVEALDAERAFADVAASWHAAVPLGPDDARWLPFATALADRTERSVARALDVIEALGEGRVVRYLREALRASDIRTRADALEALVSLPNRALLRPFLPMLERRIARPASPHVPQTHDAARRVLAAASADADPWLAAAARQTASMLELDIGQSPPAAVVLPLRSALPPSESVMDELLALKRIAYLADMTLETLTQVSRIAERVACEAGDPVPIGAGNPVFILIEGNVEVDEAGRPPVLLQNEGSFGEAGLIDDAMPPLAAVARTPARLLRLHEMTVRDLTRDFPETWPALCRLVVRRLRDEVVVSVERAAA